MMDLQQELKEANDRALRFANRWDAALSEIDHLRMLVDSMIDCVILENETGLTFEQRVEQLMVTEVAVDNLTRELACAVRTLKQAGYTDHGGEYWKPPLGSAPYQDRVFDWAVECFGQADTVNPNIRTMRFLEEALELAQACGCPRETALNILRYVYDRPVGMIAQEVGGTMVSLAVLCKAFMISMTHCGEEELARVQTRVEEIRARHNTKPDFGKEFA